MVKGWTFQIRPAQDLFNKADSLDRARREVSLERHGRAGLARRARRRADHAPEPSKSIHGRRRGPPHPCDRPPPAPQIRPARQGDEPARRGRPEGRERIMAQGLHRHGVGGPRGSGRKPVGERTLALRAQNNVPGRTASDVREAVGSPALGAAPALSRTCNSCWGPEESERRVGMVRPPAEGG